MKIKLIGILNANRVPKNVKKTNETDYLNEKK